MEKQHVEAQFAMKSPLRHPLPLLPQALRLHQQQQQQLAEEAARKAEQRLGCLCCCASDCSAGYGLRHAAEMQQKLQRVEVPRARHKGAKAEFREHAPVAPMQRSGHSPSLP